MAITKNTITPKVIEHATTLYTKLAELAETENVEGHDYLVFRGSLTKVFTSLGISQVYYSPVRNLLLNNKCMDYVERGVRNTHTVLLLRAAPNVETILAGRDLTTAEEAATLEEVVKEVQALQEWRKTQGGLNIVAALANMERRLTRLEAAAAPTEGKKIAS